MLKKSLLYVFFFFILLYSVFCEELITSEWQSVMGGDVVAPPKRTTYGFIALSEGRIMNASTENGTIIWRRNIKGLPSEFFSVTQENFVYITTDKAKKLSLYNPDGSFLWEVELESPAIQDPLPGRDGRVFILEENAISCYGAKGIKKWRTEVPQSGGLPLVEMNDGSLLYVLDFSKNNASVAIRYSPYGEKLEDVQFIDTITTLEEYSNGVILGFQNGLVGSCAVIDNVTETTGSVSHSVSGGIPRNIVIGQDGFSVLFSNGYVAEYSIKDQTLLWNEKLPSAFTQIGISVSFIDGIYVFASSEYVAAYHSTTSNIGGLLAWERHIKPVSKSFFPVVTNSAYLVLSHSNWVISGYNLLGEDVTFTGVEADVTRSNVSYKGFRSKSGQRGTSLPIIAETLQNGEYGVQEAEYRRTIDMHIGEYREEYFNFSNNANIAEKAQVYLVASLFDTSQYTYVVPLLLNNEKDTYFIQLAFEVASNIAYDPNEVMLKAIENYYNKNKSRLNVNAAFSLCDAVYEICRYMGRPALTKRGKQILSEIMITNSNATVQQKVSETLYKFIELEN